MKRDTSRRNDMKIDSLDDVEGVLSSITDYIIFLDDYDKMPPKGSKALEIIQNLFTNVDQTLQQWRYEQELFLSSGGMKIGT